MNFGQYINSLRKKEGLSIDGLAMKSGLSKSIITAILHRNYVPSAKHLIILSKILMIDPARLFMEAKKMTLEMQELLYSDYVRMSCLYHDAHEKKSNETQSQ
jgi:transcriptional regulator with XRE-family HTH domain